MFWKYSDAKYEKKVKQNIRKTGDIKEVENHDSLMELSGKYVVLYNRRRA